VGRKVHQGPLGKQAAGCIANFKGFYEMLVLKGFAEGFEVFTPIGYIIKLAPIGFAPFFYGQTVFRFSIVSCSPTWATCYRICI